MTHCHILVTIVPDDSNNLATKVGDLVNEEA